MQRSAKLTLEIRPKYIPLCGGHKNVSVLFGWVGGEGKITINHSKGHILTIALSNVRQEIHGTLEDTQTLWDNPIALLAVRALAEKNSAINIVRLNDSKYYIHPSEKCKLSDFISNVS